MAAELPLGATTQDTGEFLLGRIGVTPIFLESDGSIDEQTQNWTPQEIDEVLAKITDGVNWWSDALDQLNTVHTLEFVIDDTYARNPVPTGYEPIDRISNHYDDYVGGFLDFVGVDPSLQIDDGMFEFNNSQREKLQTDWAFSLFIADSSTQNDGFFEPGGSFRGAFAFAGGLFIIAPSTRPAATFAHEMGHIFWAIDEYAGGGNHDDSRGYYNTPNTNAWDNPTPGFVQQTSIMAGFDSIGAAYPSKISPANTLALVGWQDSDGDGIFDVLDVPLSLEGAGGFNSQTSQFDFTGTASVGTLPNRNPSGQQSDITLNRISRLEMAVDEGEWTTIESPNTYTATFDLSLDVPPDFSSVAFRVIDAATGVTSETWTAQRDTPLRATSRRLSGMTFLDADASGSRVSGEPLLGDIPIHITASDGSELPSGNFAAADAPINTPLSPVDGITITGEVLPMHADAEVQLASDLDDTPLVYVFDVQLQSWTARLGDRTSVKATFDEPTSYVEVDVVGLQTGDVGAYARIEAFNAAGNLIDRSTTDIRNDDDGRLSFGQQQTLRLQDPDNTIVSVRIAGHAGTLIGMSAIRTGIPNQIRTDAHGGFSIENLPNGEYTFTPVASQVTHRFAPMIATPTAGTPLLFAAEIVDSPRFNTVLPQDVSGDGIVTAVDALQVINDLNTLGARALSLDEIDGNKIDVTNDGLITALDALRVINFLNENDGGIPPQSEPIESADNNPVGRSTTTDLPPAPTALSPTHGIDAVLTESVKWIAPPDDEITVPITGLVFDRTTAE